MAEPDIRLVAGLGNPGAEYAPTRHNAGFMVVDGLRDALSGIVTAPPCGQSRCWQGRCRGRTLWLQQPLAFMNCSGEPVLGMLRREGLAPAELLVVHDDLDLPLGRLRLRRGGGSGGHRGVESVLAAVGADDFGRLRVGIGRGENGAVAHVLAPFTPDEEEVFRTVLAAAVDAAKLAIHRGLDAAMNEYNGRRYGDAADQPDQDQNTEDQP